ncbi:MAG: AEC family transporter [Nanoarchaeota archaeon]|nr:AEC family transporter [Nanoarchaeota archaeon]
MAYILLISFILGLITAITLNNKQLLKKILNNYLIYIGFPIFLFVLLLEAKNIDLKKIVIFSLIANALLFIIAFIIVKKLKFSGKTKAAVFLNSSFGNIGFIGIPVLTLLIGEKSLGYASIYVLSINLIYFTLAVFLANYFTSGKKGAFFEFLKSPGIYTSIAAFLLSRIDFAVPELIKTISHLTVYIAVFICGLSFNYRILKKVKDLRPYMFGALFKFLVFPLILVAGSILSGMDMLFTIVLLILATTPPAVANISLSIKYKFDEEFSGIFTVMSTFIYLVVIAAISLFAI